MRMLARRTASGFIPADHEAEEEFRRVPLGRVAYFEITTARNPNQHRLLFALLKMLVNAGCFPTTKAALKAVKWATGHVEIMVIPGTGEVITEAKSISFANMSQADFVPFFDAAINAVCERWLPGITNEQMRKEIQDMIA